jgi:pyrimidine operon attenuation protein/uracil phosphoribosyltransferase
MKKWAIDLDGVITANPPAMAWFLYHLLKNENDNEVYIITWRNGADEIRRKETLDDLNLFGIRYTDIVMAPRKFKTLRMAAFWKISQIKKLDIDVWLDDELKNYTRDLGIDLERLLPNVIKIYI